VPSTSNFPPVSSPPSISNPRPRRVTFRDPNVKCFRCGEKGHIRSQCRNPSKIFCSRCGKMDVMSRDCPCSGNDQRIAG